ncbi:MAG: arsinothricin resistance N-acetyltransferase ArsN1 family B [Gammaproteobacteria bacterium]
MAQATVSGAIRPVSEADAAAIARLYNPFIRDTVITFEEEPVDAEEISARIRSVTARLPWLVFEEQGQVLGYAYASHWRSRSAYRFSVETSVYVAPHAAGRGIGGALYEHLIARLREQGIHSVVGALALPNAVSVRLHEKLGFRKVAHFSEVGFKQGRWIDVGYWELIL